MQATLLRRLAAVLCVLATPAQAEPRFEGYEIRVIRPRYFIKSGSFEAAAGAGAIVNQTFVYSFLATGLLTYHVSEEIALEAQLGYGTSLDRQDKRDLEQRFGIKTILLRPETLANGRFVWTPSYGKFHLTSSRIMYFDTHVTVGAGLTGVRHLYDHCESPADVPAEARGRVEEPPAPRLVQYPTAVLGVGQRYFLDASSSLRLGFELQRFVAKKADGACGEAAAAATEGSVTGDDLLLFAAWSIYL